ncbi:MAG: class I SAM-dependent methyltransferase [Lewinellaceae bacterium]|nr:class I SAM-dependent methyltransferase [Saprospiraceae bacterium]MCB9332967.1 class I SAM-dependent methyltransferase [Lewinellaceae bacterium]
MDIKTETVLLSSVLRSISIRLLARFRAWRYPGSIRYWEQRYARGGHSGAGSSGRLAAYKATWLNSFVQEKNVQTVVEFGCGDGRQLQLANYPDYLGLDVAPTAVRRCQALFKPEPNKRFQVYDPYDFDPTTTRAELGLSVEVLFHLTEDALYQRYLEHLFGAATRWVVIFAPDEPDRTGGQFPHLRPRPFTRDIPAGWILRRRDTNPHRDISMSDFFVFEKNQ